jgi:hypothetical protein
MAWSQNDLTVLEKAIATGATSVQYADKKVDYRSLAEMMELRDNIRGELGLVDLRKTRRAYASFDKGIK